MLIPLRAIARVFEGYPGVFIVSVLGNLVPFIPIPYLAAVYLYALKLQGANPLIIGVVSGMGGAVGKMAAYMLGRGARMLISKDKAARYERIGRMLKSYGALAAFLFAVTPSPDDAIVIPLGLMKYDALKVFLGLAAGKTVLSTATAYAGFIVARISRYELLLEFVASVLLFAIVILLLTYLDWEKILEAIAEEGLRGFLRSVRKNGLSLLLRKSRGGLNGNR